MREPRNQSRAARILSVVFFMVALVVIAFYIRAHEDLLRLVRNVSIRNGVWLLLLSTTTLAINGLFLKTFAAKYGVELRMKEWFGLATVTAMGNYLTPFSGGMIARATYLKQRHNLTYSKFATLLAANYFFVYLIIGLAGILLLCTSILTSDFSLPLLLFFATVVVLILTLFMTRHIPINEKNRYLATLGHAIRGWEEITRDGFLITKILFLTILNSIVGGLLFYAAFDALGVKVLYTTALLIYLATSFSLLVNITPGNFGVQEAFASFFSSLLGAGADLGLMAALVIRVFTIASAFTLGPFCGMLLAREMVRSKSPVNMQG